ncbi:MAG: hypothetical protein L7T19_04550, partial [Pseudomonadales bacterium]|nr:hypothetical protein [Pseudomonadales bacterium]
TLRDPQWQAEILQKTLNERKVFGAGLRAQSRSSNANKPTNIMDVNAKATEALMSHYGAHTLIHGHTHRPGRHEHDNFLRLVMGAWMHCGWLCRQNGSSFSLECFSLARRYEI